MPHELKWPPPTDIGYREAKRMGYDLAPLCPRGHGLRVHCDCGFDPIEIERLKKQD